MEILVDYGWERLSRALSVLRLTNFIPRNLTFFLHYLEGTVAEVLGCSPYLFQTYIPV